MICPLKFVFGMLFDGGGSSPFWWSSLVEVLAPFGGHRCDFSGCGWKEKPPPTYTCYSCNPTIPGMLAKVFKQQNQSTHKDDYFVCPTCGSKFRLLLTLDAHMKRIHEQNPIFRCVTCGNKVMKDGDEFDNPNRTKHRDCKHSCGDCKNVFKIFGNILPLKPSTYKPL